MKKTLMAGLLLLAASVFAVCQPAPALAKEARAEQISVSQVLAKVNVNEANLEQLESIRGVGPALAQRILEYRNQNGKFKSVEDLTKVKGIGQAKLDRMKDQMLV